MFWPEFFLHSLPSFFYRQLTLTPPYPSTDCTGKTLLVTGANTGLGKEAARHYVRLNAEKVIIACRSVEKGEAAVRDIEQTTGRKGVCEVWQLDLGSYENVKEFAGRVKGLRRVDGFVENAVGSMPLLLGLRKSANEVLQGISTSEYKLVEGNESTITVNVVSTFLLALLVIPKLQQTAREFNIVPTLTIVSSEVHFFTPFPERKAPSIFATVNDQKEARMADRYNVSKMLEVLACREIASLHPVSQLNVTLNFVNPGLCYSELLREMSGIGIRIFMKLLARTTEVGSRTLVHAGLAEPETHGKYLSDCRITECATIVEGKGGAEVQRRWWGELAQKLEEIQPGVTKVLDAKA
ncbi:uncharacterized protein LTR77_010897 [Saxophila tyrrhenica]|uniref:Uncharacterized protein n=1 Tax=Saxophila tyrrhenica TaxID=1690608 RepID=A0AAV9NXZ6_9PEZI|nr:hypothetical protein LTR77_010897 [Saxophila tyrrhenica]